MWRCKEGKKKGGKKKKKKKKPGSGSDHRKRGKGIQDGGGEKYKQKRNRRGKKGSGEGTWEEVQKKGGRKKEEKERGKRERESSLRKRTLVSTAGYNIKTKKESTVRGNRWRGREKCDVLRSVRTSSKKERVYKQPRAIEGGSSVLRSELLTALESKCALGHEFCRPTCAGRSRVYAPSAQPFRMESPKRKWGILEATEKR